MIAKTLLSKQFKLAGWAAKVQHCIELLTIGEVFRDFDETDDDGEERTPKVYEKRWNESLVKMLTSLTINCVSNMILLVPIFVTGNLLPVPVHCNLFPSWNDQRSPSAAGGQYRELPLGEGGLRHDNLPQVDAAHRSAGGLHGGRPHGDRLRHVAQPLAPHHNRGQY